MDRNNKIAIVCISLFLNACMVGPNYKRPLVLVSAHFKEEKKQTPSKNKSKFTHTNWQPIHPQELCERGAWWKVFHDPVLNTLEEQLNQYNQNIVVAEANYHKSLAIIDQARASLFPSLTSAFNLFRQKLGGGTTSFISSTGGTTSAGTASSTAAGLAIANKAPTVTTYSTLLSASWEPDLWGLVRRTIEADVATAKANAALLAFTRLSAQGSLAQFYFELRTLDSNQKLLSKTVQAYKKSLQLTINQYKSGVASRANIVQAQAQLEAAQALALNNGILRGQYEHAIAVLIGRPPAYLDLKSMPLKVKMPTIPLEIPSLWLERRPDIAQAERLVQNTSALIGVAVAAFYPSLTLTGSASAAGKSFHQLIHTPSLGWSAGLQVAETLLDGGYRRATVRAAKAAYYAQIATYRQTVLTAFQDVEDNLIALRILKQQLAVQNKASASAQLALKLVTNQYKAGIVNYTSVILAQINAFNAQKSANDVAGLLMSAEVGLIKALGGGWKANA